MTAMVHLLEQSLGKLTGLSSTNCTKEHFQELCDHLVDVLSRDQAKLARTNDAAEVCEHLILELQNFMGLAIEDLKLNKLRVEVIKTTKKPRRSEMPSIVVQGEHSLHQNIELLTDPSDDEEGTNEILGRVEVKKFAIMLEKKKNNENALLQADAKRLYPINKIKKPELSNLFDMTFGGQRAPRTGDETFLATMIQSGQIPATTRSQY